MGTYKDSGIEWIGEIPEGWGIIKIKHAFKLFAGGDIDYNDYSEEQEGFYQYPILANSLENSGIIGFTSKYRFSGETITITGRGSVGVAFYRNFPYFPVVRLLVGVPLKKLSTKYVTYSINSFDTIGEQTAMTQLTTDKLGVEKIPLPPLREQAVIADFLDKKNVEIDTIIKKITQQIQTLKDYRQSLITETVTKGLNKTVTYKDSGIEWIGKIPEGWGKSDVKYLFEIISGATPESNNSEYWDGPINWITPADMNPTGPIKNGEKTITMLGYQSCGTTMIPENSIIISNRAPIGKINYNQTELCTSQGCKGLVNIKKNNLLYFYYFFIAFTNQLKLLGRGTTFLELSTKDLGNFSLIVPPLQEQAAIADFLDDKTAKINRIIAKKEQQLEIIKEHRKSLIYEYVTGKKRVKEYHEDGN